MSSTEPASKINLGFHGGGVLQARVKPDELAKLREMLGKSGGWHEMVAETGTITFDLTRIDYLLIDDESQRIGF